MSDIKSLILPFFLRHYLFLCLSYYLFSCFRHSATNYQVIQNAEVNNQIIKTKNKVFAQRDKCYMGWFFILIFHLICNENGEMLNFYSGKLVDMPRK